MVELLLSRKDIDVNFRKKNYAQKSQNEPYVLIKECPTLYFALLNNNYNIINLLLQNPNIDVNAKSIFYNMDSSILEEKSCLQIAAIYPNKIMLIIFLKHPNIDVNSLNEENKKLYDRLHNINEEEEKEEEGGIDNLAFLSNFLRYLKNK